MYNVLVVWIIITCSMKSTLCIFSFQNFSIFWNENYLFKSATQILFSLNKLTKLEWFAATCKSFPSHWICSYLYESKSQTKNVESLKGVKRNCPFELKRQSIKLEVEHLSNFYLDRVC